MYVEDSDGGFSLAGVFEVAAANRLHALELPESDDYENRCGSGRFAFRIHPQAWNQDEDGQVSICGHAMQCETSSARSIDHPHHRASPHCNAKVRLFIHRETPIMCGRFTLKTPVMHWLDNLFPNWSRDAEPSWTDSLPSTLREPRYNIAPSQWIAVVRRVTTESYWCSHAMGTVTSVGGLVFGRVQHDQCSIGNHS